MATVRHDWYQSDQKVVIDVLIKNASTRNCIVSIQRNAVSVEVENDVLHLKLLHKIDPKKSSYRISSVKIEITLQKLVGERWSSLVRSEEIALPLPPTFATLPQQPTHSVVDAQTESNQNPGMKKREKNWDKVVKEVWEKEEIDKEETKALNSLFEKIYSESNPEVQRAMNKSFTESGGTVLSTNWNEVKERKVDVKPPSGTEYKGWK